MSMKLYTDNVIRNTMPFGTRRYITTSTENLTIGRWYNSPGYWFNGTIDEVRIYDKALTDEEISALYNNRGYTTPNYPGIVLVRKHANPEPTYSISSEELTNWWNIDWQYRKSITVSEQSGNDLTDYQVKIIVDYDQTLVEFLKLSDNEIWSYIKSQEWIGKAGAYSLRERASMLVKAIHGSYSNVLGLPMQLLYQILKNEFNLDLFELNK